MEEEKGTKCGTYRIYVKNKKKTYFDLATLCYQDDLAVRVFATMPYSLSLIPEIHTVEGMNYSGCPLTSTGTVTHICAHIQK